MDLKIVYIITVMEQEYYIYKVTCIPSNKCYIGQTKKLKNKNDKPYNYGLTGRWCDHVSSSKRVDTPLAQAIREYGPDNFKIELLEKVLEYKADEREAYWIETLNTVIPNGYNVMSHSRCKHRISTSIADNYIQTATGIELKIIKKQNIPSIIYVYIDLPTERKRIVFGQTRNSRFDDTLMEANEFVSKFTEQGVPLKSSDKLDEFKNKHIIGIRTAKFNKTMVAVYIKTENDQTRICFGGKTITYEDALVKATEFINRLKLNQTFDSPQQMATESAEANADLDK